MNDDKKLEELEVKLDKVTDNLAREETKRVRAVVGMVLVLVILACVVFYKKAGRCPLAVVRRAT